MYLSIYVCLSESHVWVATLGEEDTVCLKTTENYSVRLSVTVGKPQNVIKFLIQL